MRLTYSHRQGVIYDGDRPITLEAARTQLAADRLGAERMTALRCPKTAEVSKALADQLEHAIKAAEGFNKLTERRVRSSTAVAVSSGDAA